MPLGVRARGTLAPWAVVASLPFASEIVMQALGYWINQGPVVLMIENHRTGFVWGLTRRCGYIASGLHRAGTSGGWLSNLR